MQDRKKIATYLSMLSKPYKRDYIMEISRYA